jgi:hypothetical protein
VNHRADLVSVAKSVAEETASTWESNKRKEKIFIDCGENIFHLCTRYTLNSLNLYAKQSVVLRKGKNECFIIRKLISIAWNVSTCRLLQICLNFGGNYAFGLQRPQ